MLDKPQWKKSLAWLTCVVILAMTASVAVAQGPPSSPGPTSRPGGSGAQGPPSSVPHGPANDSRPTHAGPATTGRGAPDGVGGIHERGRISLDNGTADGRYIDFEYDAEAGTLSGYTASGITWFSKIQAPSSFNVSAQGPRITMRGDGFLLAAMDTPAGLLRFEGNNSSAELVLADGVQAVANETRIELSMGNDSAMMHNATLEGGVLILERGFFVLRGPTVASAAREHAQSQQAIGKAIAEGRVAARIQVLPEGVDVLDYQQAHVSARQTQNGSHRFVVDANFTSGRAFVVEFAPGLLKAQSLGVLYYDEIDGVLQPAKIQRASSLADVLLLEPGEGAKYWHVDDLEGEQVIVAVPEFSVHAFDVYAISSAAAPAVVLGMVAAALFVTVLAAGAVAGRRE